MPICRVVAHACEPTACGITANDTTNHMSTWLTSLQARCRQAMRCGLKGQQGDQEYTTIQNAGPVPMHPHAIRAEGIGSVKGVVAHDLETARSWDHHSNSTGMWAAREQHVGGM
jgi:hypothetical protein